jgi:ABC-type transport system involved in cytochrome bd biosynthesis fused ATPase/permease subunit
VLLLHIVAGGTWFGLDVAMAVLVFTAISTDSDAVRAHTLQSLQSLQSLQLITVWPMFSAAMLSLITGILLGLGSKYGLVRYWWVAIKLVLNLLLATLIVTALRGEVAKAADLGGQLALGAELDWNFTNMIYPPIVSPTALTIAFLLAVFKPWGRIRRRSAGSPDRQGPIE